MEGLQSREIRQPHEVPDGEVFDRCHWHHLMRRRPDAPLGA